MQPRHLPPGRKRVRIQDLLSIHPGRGGVLTGHKKIRILHGSAYLKDKTKLVVCVTGSVEVFDLWVGDPSGVSLPNTPVFVVLASNPLGAPFRGIQQSCFPPACVACWIGLAILIPDFHPPKVALLRKQCTTTVAHPG